LDALLAHIRSLHYFNFSLAGVALALSSLELARGVSIPSTGIELPKVQASVGLFLVTVTLAAVTDRLVRMSFSWLARDARRPPFPWFPLGARGPSYRAVRMWLLAPTPLAGLGAGMALGRDMPGWGLLIPGFVLVGVPVGVEHYWKHIQDRTDERGGPATYSIWLLYWYRLSGMIAFGLLCAAAPILAIPSWRGLFAPVASAAALVLALLVVPRSVGGFMYRFIDRVGAKWGFAIDSPHYPPRRASRAPARGD